MSKINKTIRPKEASATKGNIASAFELFNDYSSGTDVEADLEIANNYLNICIERLSKLNEGCSEEPQNKVILTDLKLLFFRKFKSLGIKFEKDITIFIGDNGAGKTTILQAIAKTFSWINSRIIQKGRTGRILEYSDITVDCLDYCEVITNIRLGEFTSYRGSLVKSAKGIEAAKSSELDNYHHLSNLYRVCNDRLRKSGKKELNIPLLAYYSVERSILKSNATFDLEKLTETIEFSRFDAIDKTVTDGTGNISDFLQWFIFIDNLAVTEPKSKVNELANEISELKNIAKDSTHVLWNTLSEKVKLLNDIQGKGSSVAQEYENIRKIIKKAIANCHPSISDIFVDRSSGRVEVKVINDGIALNIFNISKGQQVFLSLIADLVRRLILLNPSLNNPLNGQGIVLIDEIELHLHPDWQQNIISSLIKNFPNIQFVITTHSPIVLSTVTSRKIRVLGENSFNEDVAQIPLAESYARSSSDVLQAVMHVEPTPPFPEKRRLEEYRKLIEQGDFRSAKANSLQKELEAVLGRNHQDLVRLEMVKRRREKLE